jgi:hypothetical protein
VPPLRNARAALDDQIEELRQLVEHEAPREAPARNGQVGALSRQPQPRQRTLPRTRRFVRQHAFEIGFAGLTVVMAFVAAWLTLWSAHW